jgi:hypothetical protein
MFTGTEKYKTKSNMRSFAGDLYISLFDLTADILWLLGESVLHSNNYYIHCCFVALQLFNDYMLCGANGTVVNRNL